jgi:hypothetical protein
MKFPYWILAMVMISVPVLADENGSVDDRTGLRHRLDTLEQLVFDIGEWISNHEESGSSYQVFDDDTPSKQVGELLGMASPFNQNLAMVVLEIEGRQILLRVGKHGIWWDEVQFYTTGDCTGQAYMPEGRFHQTWMDPVAISVPWDIPHAIQAFEPTGPATIDHTSIVMHGTPEGCRPLPPQGAPEGPFVPVAALTRGTAPVDLYSDYPPPYRLEN